MVIHPKTKGSSHVNKQLTVGSFWIQFT